MNKVKKKPLEDREKPEEDGSEESEKVDESLEDKFEEDLEEAPLELAEGITDSLEQVDIQDLLEHSGEGPQKQRAHLEEELAEQSWTTERDEDEEQITYGEIKKDSVNEGAYIGNRNKESKDPISDHYKTMNPYSAEEGQGNLYDSEHEKLDEWQIGQVRRDDRSQLEIQGLSKKHDMRAGDALGDSNQNENYE